MDTDFFAFPASFAQRRLWFLDQLQPDSPIYNVSHTVALPGTLNERAIRAAIEEIVRRHDTLRTTLPALDGQPYQLISSQAHVPLRLVDLRGFGAVRQGHEVTRVASDDASVPFDLANGPLFRVSVLHGHKESFVVFTMHHAITDGTSMDLLGNELTTLYDTYSHGTPSPLPELPVQYGDYAVWQRAWLAGDSAAEHLKYWKEKLAGAPQVLELPWDRPRPAAQSRDGATQTITLSRRLTEDVMAFSRKERVTPFMTLLGAFQILMARLSGTRDIVIGTPIAGRARSELEHLIGFFVNTLPLRTDLDGNPTLRDVVHRAETTAMDAYARQDLPFDRIVTELAPERTLSHNPLIQVLFALQNFGTTIDRDDSQDEAEEVEDVPPVPDVPAAGAKFDLTWTLVESETGISGQIEYSTALLDAATVGRWAALYKRILHAVVTSPETQIEDLSLLSPAERDRAISEWNDTDRDYPRTASLIDLFAEQVAAHPDAVAVVYGDRSLTYRELDRQSLDLARRLIAAGVTPGDRVGLSLHNSPELVVSVLAVVRCSAVYVPLEPSYPKERVRAITEDAGTRLILTSETMAALPHADAGPLPHTDGDAIAYVMYTSGSTGRPKGVSIQHRAIVRLVRNTNYVEITSADRIAQASNAAFDAATFEIWGALLNGATLVGINRDTVLSPRRYAQALRRDRISVVFVTTALFNQIARDVPDAFATVRQVMFGGEAAEANAVRAVLEAGRPARLMNVYGPTETTTFATFHEITTIPDDDGTIPIGRPLANTQIYVLDDRLEPQVVGVSGELYIGGDGLALEYWGAPELTADRFIANPFRPNQRLYRTGDIARYLSDGSVEFVGRRDHQVKIRGFRIELAEIESVLAAHDAIREAVVAAHAANGSPAQLLGYIVWKNGQRPTVTELRDWVGARLPDYMIPAHWIELDALPLNANGKLDRHALPSPGSDRPDLGIAYAQPVTDTERQIAAIWSQLLGIESIGLDDNFFALGGHSLLATQAVARVRDRLHVDMPVRVMFERPTIAALAEWADFQDLDATAPQHRGIARRHSAGPAPLSFSQQRLWFLDQLEPNSILYNIQTVHLFENELDIASLEKAVSDVLRRHEILRTRFTVSDGVAVQVVDPHRNVSVDVVDLSHLPMRAAEKEYARRADADAHTSFNLATGPLFRAHVISVNPGDHRLVMTMHHVISDGWSLGVLHRELTELYSAYAGGREPKLPSLPIQYADFAVWQRQRLQGEELAQLLGWWRTYLNGAPHVINLPTDRTRPSEQTFRGETQTKRLADALRPALEALGQREGATLFITLLTAWFVLLHRFSGEEDIVIGTPIANRTRSELEPLIGFFVNTLLIRASIDGNPTFRELLRQVRDAANGAYAHQDLPFERLVSELAPERRLSHTPLFQCFFALQNEAAGLRVLHLSDEIETSASTSMFDLSLTVLDAGADLAASFEYSTELFDASTVTRLMGHLERLLDGIAADADRPVFGYDLLSASERREVIVEFNDTAAAYPPCDTVIDLFEQRVAKAPSAIAVLSEEGTLTYHELNAAANRLAHHLRASTVERGSLVGLALDRSPDLIVALFAILKAGAAYVPLDPQYPKTRLAQIVADARLAAIVTSQDLAVSLPDSAPLICLDTDAASIGCQPADQSPARVSGADTAYVIYTSGSTGEPKGVPIHHRALLNYTEAASEGYEITARDSVLQFGSISFDTSVEEIFPTLTRGGTLVLRTPLMAASIGELLTRAGSWGVSVITLPTAFWHEMVVRMRAEQLALPRSLRLVIVGGDRMLPERVAEWMSYVRGRVQLVNGYGPTEVTVVATLQRLESSIAGGGEVPIGKPIRNTRVYVLDRYQQPVPIGVRGDLWIAGDGLSNGYLHRPDLTRERFASDPFVPGDRMYRSGDVACWLAGGILEFRGRSDRQVKVRGFRIELAEIESALHQHSAVKESVVVAHEDARGHKRLVAYVVTADADGDVGNTHERVPVQTSERARQLMPQLRAHLAEQLPGYMVPAHFMLLDELPLTPTGKLDRKALPVPDHGADPQLAEAKPRTRAEETLARIWSEVLELSAVGINDNFFQLGGDSILSIQVIARANEAGLQLTPKQLFQHQTIAELASVAGSSARAVADQREASGAVPLTPIQRWFFGASLRRPQEFTQSAVFELDRSSDLSTAHAILEHLQTVHDAFRLRFARDEHGWRQFHAEAGTRIPVTEVSLAALDPDQCIAKMDEVTRQLQEGLNVTSGPIARAALFTAAAGDAPQLLLVAHHLIVDGVSWRILQQDFRTLLDQLSEGRPFQLPARTTSFQYWANRLIDYADSPQAEQALDFWVDSLADVDPELPLDVYEPNEIDPADSSRLVTLSFTAEETQKLLHEVPKAYRTQINDVLLAALAESLAAWTGRSQVLIDVEGHGREPIFDDVDLSRTVGWFTSVFPVALDLSGVNGAGDVLKTVKEQLRRVPDRGIPFGVLRYLNERPDVSVRLRHLPQPRVCFNYLGQFGAVRLSPEYEAALSDQSPDGAVVEISSESTRGEWGSSSHLLDINGGVGEGRLWLTWAFSTRFHRPPTIEAVARRFATELRRLIAHCTSPAARGYSPSDFPLASLDQEKLDWLVGSDREITDLYPLSPMQSGMLFHSLYAPESGEYIEQSFSELPADLDISAFRRAWDLIVERHAILRTCFLWSGLDEPLQMVRQRVDSSWQVHDLSELEPEHADEVLTGHLDEDRTRGFDLARAPLMRFALFRMPSGAWSFLWTSHHILLDGWSQARLKAELQLFYDAVKTGRHDFQVEAVRPFRHYIEWLQEQDLTRAETFWRETLRGFTTPTPLVVCEPAETQDDEEKEYLEQQIELSVSESAAIDALVRQAAVTPNTAAQGAWALLLGRYNGESDVLFGATVAGRPTALAGVERMIGLFINTLPVRVRIQPDATVAGWLNGIQRQQIDAREYEHTPLVQIQAWSEIPRGVPLFDSLIVFENYPDVPSFASAAEEPDDEYADADTATDAGEPSVPLERTNFPLTVAVIPGDRWCVRITYDAARFTADAIARLLGQYRTILSSFASDASQRLEDISLLTPSEWDRLVLEWNATDAPPSSLLAHRYFEEQVARTPDAVAVEIGDERLTYAELNARANDLAHRLMSLGAAPGVLAGICLDRSMSMAVAVLATLKAGSGYVPLDPAYPSERLTYMLEDSRVRVLVTETRFAERFASLADRLVLLDAGHDGARDAALGAGHFSPTANPNVSVSFDDVAYVIYTSGSTGRPKGVAMPHGPLANLLEWHVTKGTPRTNARTLQFAPLSFDVHFQEMFSTWAGGGTLVLISEALRRDMPALVRYAAAHDVDRIFVPFVALQSFAEVSAGAALPPLREVITAGEQLHASPAIRALFARLPGATLHNHYGPSETHVVTSYSLSANPEDWEPLPPIGRPIDNAKLYVLDSRMRPVPIGVTGELYIGGSVLAHGYVNRPDLTAARFVPDPFAGAPDARLYATGDLARYLPDGNIEFLGRSDFQVKVRGFRIELGEPEAVLAEHPDVEQAVVSVWEDSPGEKRLVAYVVPRQPAPAIGSLRSFMDARLPDYMVPSTFMLLPSLPLTPSGKVDRQALPEPDRIRPADGRPYRAPRDPVEERLAAIYQDVLHVDAIGVDDNFFDLGGHSLLATRIISRIRDAFQAELPLRTVFERPTVAAMAPLVIAAGSALLREQRIPRRREAGTCPLSYAQQRLWFLEQLHPNTSLYNVSRTFAFSGGAQKEHIETAINDIVRRHEALRTTYASIEGRPFQLIAASQQIEVPFHDLRRYGAARKHREYLRILSDVAETPFDLSRGPVIRAAFARLSNEQSALIVAIHHIATDGWSMDVFARELERLCEAAAAGHHAELPELPIQYADYAVWQRQRLEGETAALELVQCRNRLANLPGPIELPWDRQRPAVASRRGATISFPFPSDLAADLIDASRKYDVTLFTTLLAGFNALLARLTNSHDIVIGTPVSGRSHTEIEGLIGFFVNTLVLRTDLSGNPTLREVVRRVEQSTLDAFDSQAVPFDRLVSELAPTRHLSHHPLVQVMFSMQEVEDTDLSDDGSAGASPLMTIEPGEAKFDLTLTISSAGGRLTGAIEFSTELLEPSTVERWAELYIRTLQAIVNQPEKRTDEFALLSVPERQRALVTWNDTVFPYPRESSLCDLFAEQVGTLPHEIAVTYGAATLTYVELDRLAGRVAAFLRYKGIHPGSRVAVLMERSPEWIAALLGIVRCGAAYVPLDPEYPEARRRRILSDARVDLTLTEQSFVELPCDPDPAVRASAQSIAYVMYTSGSTGDPKGIEVSHRAIVRLVRNTNYVHVTAGDRVAQASHAAFDAATFEIWGPLLNGAAIVGIDRDTALTPARYARALRESRVSIVFVTTALFNQIVREDSSAFATVKQVMFGGEAADVNVIRGLLGNGRPERLMNVYGPTETTTFATFYEIENIEDDETSVPIGFPIGNTQVYVLDDRLEPQPPGVPGEIYIGGDGLAAGYINADELTTARFVPNPHGEGRLYRTGDVGRYRGDGAIEFMRRTDDQVKVRGFRVEPGEIEAALRQHPSIGDAVIQAIATDGGPRQLAAYVVPSNGTPVDVTTLREWLGQRVPPYMIPAHWTELASLPLNANGKVDRRALPAPESDRPALVAQYAEPATPLQGALASIWRDVLRMDRIGVNDSFFELGGHSLLAMQVVSRLRDALRVDVPVRMLFERPTIAALAQALGDAPHSDAPTEDIRRRTSVSPAPLSFSQERLWFLDQIDPGTALFNIRDVIELPGLFRQDALERAVSEVVRRHEVLRTSLVHVDGVATQVVDPSGRVMLPPIDLTRLPLHQREAEVTRLAIEQSQQPFVLSRAPLFRAQVVKVARRDHRLLLTLHHVAADGWSLGVIRRELRALYSAYAEGQPSPLPELPVQYGDFAVWQRARVSSGALQAQVDYWKQQLAKPPRVLELPLDRPRPVEDSTTGARWTRHIPPGLSAQLRTLCRQTQVTPFMLLLAALDVVLHRYTGETDLLIGCPIAGRTRPEIENLIGFFLNTLALRIDASGDPAFSVLLDRVRRTTLDAFANQEVPYERILEELAPDRTVRAPLFRIYFNVLSFDAGDQEQPAASTDASELPSAVLSPADSIFDFTLYVFDDRRSFRLEAVYRTELFEHTTISRLLDHLICVLETVIREPDCRLSRFELREDCRPPHVLPALQRIELRRFRPEDVEQSIGQRFATIAARDPRRIAVKTRRHEWTYAELLERAHRVSDALDKRSLAAGERVALLCAHDAPMVAGLLGVLMAGCVYVPLDPSYPRERLLHVLADAGPVCILTDSAHDRMAATFGIPAVNVETAMATSVEVRRPASDPDALAYILYTSGSSGQPKGVVQNHRNVLHHIATYTNALRLRARDRITLLAAYGFDAAVMDIFGALLNGASLYPIDVKSESPETIADWLANESITVLHSTPTIYRYILAHNPDRRFPTVRAVVLGGEEAVRRDFDLYRAHFSARCVFVNGLGPTESTLALQYFMDHDTALARNSVPVGHPVAGTEVLILDETGRPIAGCGRGELAFRSRHVALGYWRAPELTGPAFVRDAEDATLTTYRTGDIGQRLPDGRIEFVGRRDQQVKIRGVRIELSEVELRLLEHDSVQSVVVRMVDRDGDAADDRRLVAYVVTKPGQRPSNGELSTFLRQRLPEAMIPSAFVPLDALPLTPNGKIDQRSLPAPDWDGRSGTASASASAVTTPSTATERALAAIWSTLLRVPEISVTDNFFELGGHSLLATQLASRVRSGLHVDLPLRQYFATPVLGSLAALIDEHATADAHNQPRIQAIPRVARDQYRVRVSHAGELILPAIIAAEHVDVHPSVSAFDTSPAPVTAPDLSPFEPAMPGVRTQSDAPDPSLAF